MTVCHVTRSKVKVKALKVRNASIFKIISSAIFSRNWQVTADSYTRGKYLNLFGPDFLYLS